MLLKEKGRERSVLAYNDHWLEMRESLVDKCPLVLPNSRTYGSRCTFCSWITLYVANDNAKANIRRHVTAFRKASIRSPSLVHGEKKQQLQTLAQSSCKISRLRPIKFAPTRFLVPSLFYLPARRWKRLETRFLIPRYVSFSVIPELVSRWPEFENFEHALWIANWSASGQLVFSIIQVPFFYVPFTNLVPVPVQCH